MLRHRVIALTDDGMTTSEIAEVLGIPPGTVRSRIARGRAALADILGEALNDSVRDAVRFSLDVMGVDRVEPAFDIGLAWDLDTATVAFSGRVPVTHRGTAAGVINAGGSFGQFVFAPLLQTLISLLGWMGAMWGLAVIALLALPLVKTVAGPAPVGGAARHATMLSNGTL